jgi:50S ribosomal subunit-associated GTPase HflX
VLVIANKADLKKSNIKKIQAAFPQYPIVSVSAKYGKNIDELYEQVIKTLR